MKTHLLSKPRSSPVYFLLLGSADLYRTLSLIRRPVSLQTKCCSTSLVDLSTGSLCKRADTGNCGWNDLLASFVKVELTPSTAVSGLRFLEIHFFSLHHSAMVYCAQLPKCKLYLTNFCSCVTRLFFWRYFVQVSSKEAGEGSCHRLYRPRCGKLPTKWIKIFVSEFSLFWWNIANSVLQRICPPIPSRIPEQVKKLRHIRTYCYSPINGYLTNNKYLRPKQPVQMFAHAKLST